MLNQVYHITDNYKSITLQFLWRQSEDGTPFRWIYWKDYIKMINDEIEAIKHSEKSRTKKVVCLNTKVVFNSATIAGKWCGVGKNSIRRSALKERASGGAS